MEPKLGRGVKDYRGDETPCACQVITGCCIPLQSNPYVVHQDMCIDEISILNTVGSGSLLDEVNAGKSSTIAR